MRISLVVTCFGLMALSACSASRSEKSAADSVQAAPKLEARQMDMDSLRTRRAQSPNSIRVIGTVVSIDPVGSGAPHSGSGGPCAKVPCVATVRVDSVLSDGMGSVMPFGIGESVKVRFAYTLSPTREVLPNLKQQFPGLVVGSRFEADMIRPMARADRPAADRSSSSPAYIIAEYAVR